MSSKLKKSHKSNFLNLFYASLGSIKIEVLLVKSLKIHVFLLQIMSPTALFLAAKVEEQPRKLEHVIKVANACLHPQEPQLDTKSDVGGSYGFKDTWFER